ncbi:MAG TPA: hypothetical protein GX497_01615, partial [Bacillus bacterium]|nr:hypothetical protein [Bacillus sp. (in: firmicutes)]HHY71931.1 hypothetical protein [Bacillus sp. (in: firmicutes)]
FFVIMAAGGLTARNGQDMIILKLLDEEQGAFWVSGVFYASGLLVTFISSAYLKKIDMVSY